VGRREGLSSLNLDFLVTPLLFRNGIMYQTKYSPYRSIIKEVLI
jgi:hypothetical protein